MKLDTNGYMPEVLAGLLEKGLLDYVAMDVKASLENYQRAAGYPGLELHRIRESISLLKRCKIPYEFRTTVVRGIHTVEEFDSLGELLKGAEAYYLQGFRDGETVIQGGLSAFPREIMVEMQERAKKYIDKVELRGVE